MNEQEFFDLAIHAIAGRATPAETAALDAELSRHPELKGELDRLRAVSSIAGEAVQLAKVMENPAPAELPGYARRRLQESLKKTFPNPAPSTTLWEQLQELMRHWRWALGATATALAIALFIVLPHLNNSPKPIIQLAMLDSVGQTRGTTVSGPTDAELAATLKESLAQTNLTVFSETPDLKNWLEQWPEQKEQTVIKVWFNRDSGEVRILAQQNGNRLIGKSFTVKNEKDLPVVLKQAIESFEQGSQIPIKINQ